MAFRMQLFHKLLERKILMTVGAERSFSHLLEKLFEGQGRRNISSQRQRINEKAEQIFYLSPISSGYRRANYNITLSAVTPQQNLKRSQQCHEHGGAFVLAQRIQSGRE